LRRDGYEACTTKAVAKKAGVSIGSLYQYFPSKEALITALAQEHANRAYGLLVDSVREASARLRSLTQTITQYIRAMVNMHHVDPAIHRVLSEQVPRISSGAAFVRDLSQRSAELVRAWLEANQGQLREVALDIATFMLVTSVEAVTHPSTLTKRSWFKSSVSWWCTTWASRPARAKQNGRAF
jgi:AcrR family transcriptional regulator